MIKNKSKLNKIKALAVIGILVIISLGFYWFWSAPAKVTEVVSSVPAPKLEVVAVPFSGVYHDVQNRFTMTPPANWLMKNKDIGNAIVQFVNPVVDNNKIRDFSANINVLIEPTNLTVEKYAKASEDTLSKLLANYKLIDFKKMKFGVLDGYVVGGIFENNGLALRNRQIFIVSKGNVYIVTAISLASLWDKYVPDFKASLYGFRVQ